MKSPKGSPKRPAPVLVAREGYKLVRRVVMDRGQDMGAIEAQEKIEVPAFEVEPAYVRVSGSETVNLGNYSSVKVEVSVSLPCNPEKTSIEQAYEWCSEWVGDKLTEEKRLAVDGSGFAQQ